MVCLVGRPFCYCFELRKTQTPKETSQWTVRKEGPNQGRVFFSCSDNLCGFFLFKDVWLSKVKTVFSVLKPTGYSPQDITPDLFLKHFIQPASGDFERIAQLDQSDPAWLQARLDRITASGAHEIVTHAYRYTKGEYRILSKCALGGSFSNAACDYGKAMESVAREAYIDILRSRGYTDVHVEESGLTLSRTDPWLGASLDGWVRAVDPQGQPVSHTLEIKCPYKTREEATPDYPPWAIPYSQEWGRITPAYYAQIQLQLWVSGMKLCHFFVWNQQNYDLQVFEYNRPYLEDELLPFLRKYYYERLLPFSVEVVRQCRKVE
jgi:hypothetical protein